MTRIEYYKDYEYREQPLKFYKVELSEIAQLELIKKFCIWYGDTDQDTDLYSFEFSIIVSMLLDSYLVLNPKYLLINEVLPEMVEYITPSEGNKYISLFYSNNPYLIKQEIN